MYMIYGRIILKRILKK